MLVGLRALAQGIRGVLGPIARLLVLCFIVGTVGCSSTTFVYNRLDFILPWYLGRYVDLTADQADWFDNELETLLRWHRDEELPRYAAFLVRMEADLDQPITLSWIQEQTDLLEDAWYDLRDPALEILLDLGVRLDDEQIAEFIASLRKRQAKYERKYLRRSDEEFRSDAEDDFEDLFSDFLGRLTAQQRDRVAETASAMTRSDTIWLRERAIWIDEMERLLAREPGWQDAVRTTIYAWENELDDEAMAVYDRNTLLAQELTVEVLNTRTERQERRLRRRLGGLREDLESLAADGR